MKLSQVETRPQ